MGRSNNRLSGILKEKIEELKREIFYHHELRILFALIVFFSAFFLLARVFTAFSTLEFSGRETENTEQKKSVQAERQKKSEPQQIFVYITGAVENPGVYRLNKGARLFELLEKACPSKDSAAHLLNQAQTLEDGEMIYIPTVNEASQVANSLVSNLMGAGSGTERGSGEEKIDINTATEEELVKIPGVGTKTAQKIIEFRKKKGRIRSPEELLEIEGIGEKKLEKMKDYIRF